MKGVPLADACPLHGPLPPVPIDEKMPDAEGEGDDTEPTQKVSEDALLRAVNDAMQENEM